jgi:hypothetical protein
LISCADSEIETNTFNNKINGQILEEQEEISGMDMISWLVPFKYV